MSSTDQSTDKQFQEKKNKNEKQKENAFVQLSNSYSNNKSKEQEYNENKKTKQLIKSKNENHSNLLVIGLTYALGIDPDVIIESLQKSLENTEYKFDDSDKIIQCFRVSEFLDLEVIKKKFKKENEELYESELMHAGTNIAKEYGSHALMEIAVKFFNEWDHEIYTYKSNGKLNVLSENLLKKEKILFIYSLKRSEEVEYLKEIFGMHFIMVGVYQEEDKRLRQHIENDLRKQKNDKSESEYQKYVGKVKKNNKGKKKGEHEEIKTPENWAKEVFKTDQDQQEAESGQKLAETFALVDFVMEMGSCKSLQIQWQRLLKIIFGYPFVTPTFDELAMHIAYSVSLKSADLSRQVGAVIAKDQQILATGANDPPKFGGGCYWPEQQHLEIYDFPKGRDYIRCKNSNEDKVVELTDKILKELGSDKKDKIKQILKSEISEFGRAVHAEMDALCSAARSGISVKGATLYTTTFPCHNCAKHLLAAGIARVVFMEPYPKSEALSLHDDALYLRGVGCSESSDKMRLEHFMGLSTRAFERYFQLQTPGLISDVNRKDEFNELNKTSELAMYLKEVNKTLQYASDEKGSKDSIQDNDESDPEAKHSQCASQYFYRQWLKTKPKLRYRELITVLQARIKAWLDES